jgi:hypothetical protein
MGAPVLTGAGIGAITALATGNDVFKGAAMGGLGGGAFGGSAGFGSGFTEGGLFSLGSEAAKAGATGAVSGGATNATAFGSQFAPSSALDVAAPATEGLIGSLPYQADTGSLLTNSAGGADIYNIPESYTGFESAMQNPSITDPSVQTFGLQTNTFDMQPPAIESGGGYSPFQTTEKIGPDFTPTLGGEKSVGGGFDPTEKNFYQQLTDNPITRFAENNPQVAMAGAQKALTEEDVQKAKQTILPDIRKGELVDTKKTGSNILNIQTPKRKKPVNLFSGSKYEIRI